jgi:stage III sporulation protein AC
MKNEGENTMSFEMILKIAGIGLLVGILVMVLDQANRKEISQLTVLAGVVVVLYIVVQAVGDLFSLVKSVFQLY